MSHPLLTDFPVVLTLPVQWGEMDAYGHVNNAVLFRYFESARIVYLERCGFIESMERDRIGAILHSTACRFRLPLYYPDTVEVGGRATDVASDRFTMEYRVVSHTKGAVVAEGQGVIVSYDYTTQSRTALPEAIRRRIGAIEASSTGGCEVAERDRDLR
jgi:acyl-CoA thioester hydrolase